MNKQQIQRENLLFRYTSALEQGDFDTIAQIWQLTENDPELETMIFATNEAYYRELSTQRQMRATVQPTIANIPRVSKHSASVRRANNIATFNRWWHSAFGLAATLVGIVLFALIFYNNAQHPPMTTSPVIVVATALPTPSGSIAVITASREGRQTALYLLSSPDAQPVELTTFRGTIAEAPGQVAISPDGTLIAFTTCENGSCDLYVIGFDGSRQRQLAANVSHFSWSAANHRLVFSNVSGQLFIINDIEGTPTQVAVDVDDGQLSHPTWSPDGTQLAFVADNGAIYVMNADGSSPRMIANNVQLVVPVWSPDSQRLAFVVAGEVGDSIITVDVQTAQRRTIVDGNANGLATLGSIVKWSPDGKALAFLAYRADLQVELYVVNEQSLALQRLIQSRNLSGAFAWSPDNLRLIVSGSCNRTQGLYMLGVDGADQQCIASFAGVSALNLDWSRW